MKYEENTEFLIDWGDGQHLRVHEGIVMATTSLQGGPRPVQLATTSNTYMALGAQVPAKWLTLFDRALDRTAHRIQLQYQWQDGRLFFSQNMSLAPCDQGEHLHAEVGIGCTLVVEEADTTDGLSQALYDAWRTCGDLMGELQEEWVFPFVDEALVIEELHKS